MKNFLIHKLHFKNISQVIIFLIIINLSACGFYLRGSKNNISGNSQIAYIQAINFSNELLRQIVDRSRGVKGLEIATDKRIIPAQRVISIISEDMYLSENILDATTYNKEIRLTYTVRYKIYNPQLSDQTVSSTSIVSPSSIQIIPELLIERNATIYFSEADRLSGENKLQQAKESLFGEVSLSLLQAALGN